MKCSGSCGRILRSKPHMRGVTRLRFRKSEFSPQPAARAAPMTSHRTKQPALLFRGPRSVIRPGVRSERAGHRPCSRADNWYHGDGLHPARPRHAHGRRRWPKERASEVDSLFPGCDEYTVPGQLEWLRPVSRRGQGRGMWCRSISVCDDADWRAQNQMQDAMTIWDSICHSQWVKQTSIVRSLPR